MPQSPRFPPAAWLFCRVIDNYGDIGVSWRLACRLREAGFQVALWHDSPAVLAKLLGAAPPPAPIRLHHWQDDAAESIAAELAAAAPALVVETFGCDLPPAALAAVRAHRPLWLNWEYLSAEPWAEAMHGKPSLQADGSEKYFWLMGFSEQSGGLLREKGYLKKQQAFLADSAAQAGLRYRLGLPENSDPAAVRCFCFGYAGAVWADWLAAWQAAGEPLEVWLADHQVIDSLCRAGAIPESALRRAGDVWQAGAVRLVRIGFVPQAEFDAVLWLADVALVRGEDSFVRAQLAGKPLMWHIYPQAEQAHLPKLHAFWRKAAETAPLPAAHAALSNDLNGATALTPAARTECWRALLQQLPQWQHAAAQWQRELLRQSDAVERVLARWPGLLG
ncbi:elongation factor P maturation arginine rhamnosyltransferase EarP [Eikenella sp. S3360]|uniref:Protein-arginine rhamnosyltransferase n=1 Tax=Eikenella glucosivorans TaxID=2766967 RepID=A0ABS0N793_9NEIS|nr:elongation factor P maturation arginine rhamnosyltransferase EarP [Eikenella glucosivorans]